MCLVHVREGPEQATRRQRAKYVTQGGLEDDFIAPQAGVDVEPLHDGAIAAVDELNKYTHVRERTIVSDQAEIDAFVRDALDALVGLFASFDVAAVIDSVSELGAAANRHAKT